MMPHGRQNNRAGGNHGKRGNLNQEMFELNSSSFDDFKVNSAKVTGEGNTPSGENNSTCKSSVVVSNNYNSSFDNSLIECQYLISDIGIPVRSNDCRFSNFCLDSER